MGALSSLSQQGFAGRGIYALGSLVSIAGLPVSLTVVYVGKAEDVDRRMRMHRARNEANSELALWLNSATAPGAKKVAFMLRVEEDEDILALEASIISSFPPGQLLQTQHTNKNQ